MPLQLQIQVTSIRARLGAVDRSSWQSLWVLQESFLEEEGLLYKSMDFPFFSFLFLHIYELPEHFFGVHGINAKAIDSTNNRTPKMMYCKVLCRPLLYVSIVHSSFE